MSKIDLSYNKSLKLTNVLIYELMLSEVSSETDQIVLQMENYIRAKGASPVGPMIQKSFYSFNEQGEIEIKLHLMRQANNFINHVEHPYRFASTIRVTNCMYARFTGPGEKLKFAYDKINVVAFEENIDLSNENYTIFIEQQDDSIVADVFVEKV